MRRRPRTRHKIDLAELNADLFSRMDELIAFACEAQQKRAAVAGDDHGAVKFSADRTSGVC
jgi:hypothetical protein